MRALFGSLWVSAFREDKSEVGLLLVRLAWLVSFVNSALFMKVRFVVAFRFMSAMLFGARFGAVIIWKWVLFMFAALFGMRSLLGLGVLLLHLTLNVRVWCVRCVRLVLVVSTVKCVFAVVMSVVVFFMRLVRLRAVMMSLMLMLESVLVTWVFLVLGLMITVPL